LPLPAPWCDRGATSSNFKADIMTLQPDLFPTAVDLPATVLTDDVELDNALAAFQCSDCWIINEALRYDQAEYLCFLRRTNALTQQDIDPWKHQHADLLKRRLIRVTSKKPLQITIDRARIISMATEQNCRRNAWIAVEMGRAEWIEESGKRVLRYFAKTVAEVTP
jgi:hypothetical protein